MREQNLNKILKDWCTVHLSLKSLSKMKYGFFFRGYATIIIYIFTGYYTNTS